MNRTRCQVPKQGLLLLTAALLSGCAGPSTRVLPQRQGGTMQEVPDEIPVVEEVNSFYLQESLGILSASARPAGSREEDSAARYIQKLLKDYGYAVSRQRFRQKTEHAQIIGTNVTAVRQAEDPDASVLGMTRFRTVRVPERMHPVFRFFWRQPVSFPVFRRIRSSVSSACRPMRRMRWERGCMPEV